MGKKIKKLRYILFCFYIIFLCFLIKNSAFAATVTITSEPFSGIAPLDVRLICIVAPDTSPPKKYEIDFGDESDPISFETNNYSITVKHTYTSGFFKPICTVTKEIGATSNSDPTRVIVAKWKFETNGQIDSSPAIDPDGTVYVGSDDGNLYAIDPETGFEKWRFLTGAEIQSSPAVGSDGTIYFGSLDNNFYALKKRYC
jgi:hypothetical protein